MTARATRSASRRLRVGSRPKGCESTGCTTTALLAAGQWMLAPTDLNGRNARADLRPHIVNNSWGDSVGRNTFFNNVINAWIASGIFPVFSNGNYGPWCQTAGSPADYSAGLCRRRLQRV